MEQGYHSPASNPNRTPSASRPYLNAGHVFHTPHPNSRTPSHSPQAIHESPAESSGYIFGTSIDNQQVQAHLQKFILEFDAMENDEMHHKKYLEDLKTLANEDTQNILEVEAMHIKEFDKEMYYQFIYFPAEMISAFDYTIKAIYDRMFIEPEPNTSIIDKKKLKKLKLMVSIVGLEEITKLMDLEPRYINRLIAFRGIVIRCSDLYPEMKAAMFRCTNPACGEEVQVELENAKVEEPKACTRCRTKNSMEIQHNLSQFTDKQFVKFQELPEYVPEGQTPNSIQIVCYDTSVDQMKPGDRVQVVGIYRSQPVRVMKNRRAVRSLFNTYVDLISSKVLADNRFASNFDTQKTTFDDDQKRRFFDMAGEPGILDRLVKSFAPSIYANEEVKQGVLCQLFGGCQKQFSQSGRGRFRSDINICLVGDPSTAKSQMLQQVYKIAPRGIYTSGKGSSAVGLTANVRKDPETGEYILESGALVLSDRGICCIDEFDKMDDNSRTILLEAMQQQTISVAKAGIVCSLNSRTAILAAANPVNSRYNPKKSVVQNINLQPALLSRFDLIYIMLDKANEAYDTRLAHHILSIYTKKKDNYGMAHPPYNKTELTNYITFARQEYFPQLTEEACNRLSQAYVEMRNINSDRKTVTATPRQLESMIRLSEAFAKMRLSTEVQVIDVENSISLIKSALQQAATDPRTGLIDMDVINTGRTTSMRLRVNRVCQLIKEQIDANIAKYRSGTNFDEIFRQISTRIMDSPGTAESRERLTQSELKQALRLLESEGLVALYGASKNKPSVKLSKDMYKDN